MGALCDGGRAASQRARAQPMRRKEQKRSERAQGRLGKGAGGDAPGPAPPRRLIGCTAGRASRPLLHMLRVP